MNANQYEYGNKTFILFGMEYGTKDVLSFLRENASRYKMLGAFPVCGPYNILGKFQGDRDKVYNERVSDIRRRNDRIRSTLTIGTIKDIGFEKEENITEGKKSFCLINTNSGKENQVFKQLDAIKDVTEAYPVYGIYDIVTKYEAKSSDELENLFGFKIRRIPDIRSALNLNVVEGGFIVDDKGNIVDYPVS